LRRWKWNYRKPAAFEHQEVQSRRFDRALCGFAKAAAAGHPEVLAATAAPFAKIGYDFVAQAPPSTTFGAGGDLPPPSFRLPLHRTAFQFERSGLSDTLLI
jgi:hypothetical protein